MLHDTLPETINSDIPHFSTEKLEDIAGINYLCTGWPGREIIQQLVKNANGLFIWAATAYRFIDKGQNADDRLLAILQNGSSNTTPQKHLDEIYHMVFTHSSICLDYGEVEKGKFYRLLRQIVRTIVILFAQLPANSLGQLLSITRQDIGNTLKDLPCNSS
jgi:hypothetical protein